MHIRKLERRVSHFTIGEVERRNHEAWTYAILYFAWEDQCRGKLGIPYTSRIVFKVTPHLWSPLSHVNTRSTTGLLYDLRAIQVQLVEDIVEGQRVTHSKLDMILIQVRAIGTVGCTLILEPS